MHDRKLPLTSPAVADSAPRAEADPGGTYRIFVRDLVVPWNIGVYVHEKALYQPVRINLDMQADTPGDRKADDYHTVVCYEAMVNAVTRLAEDGHVNLVETLAERIAEICCGDPRVRRVTVRVEKLAAIPAAASVGVEIARSRADYAARPGTPPIRVIQDV